MADIVDLILSEHGTIVEALKRLDRTGKKILFVIDDNGLLSATITDGDIRRWILASGDLGACVSRAMHREPRYIRLGNEHNAYRLMKKYLLDALPVVNENGKLIDVIFRHEQQEEICIVKNSLEDIPIVIMAGGKGTRLFPYTKILPKPLIPIGDTPIIERIIDNFHQYGAKSFFITLNYKKNMIKAYFAELNKSFSLKYVDEDQPLGTAGSIALLKGMIDKTFFVSNCDIFVEADYSNIYKHHKKDGNKMTMVVSLKNVVIPYGVVHLKNDGSMDRLEEKPELNCLINTGLYVLEPEVLGDIPPNKFFHMTELMEKLLLKGEKVGIYPVGEDSFMDMGQFDEMEKMIQKFAVK